MIRQVLNTLSGSVTYAFPTEWVKSALLLALMSTCAVIALFVYLNRNTKKLYFSYWTVSWMFYAVYLAASIGLQDARENPFLIMVQRASISIGAAFMFWGSFQLTNSPRDPRELQSASIMLVLWSGVAAYVVRDRLWITLPVFALLSAAGIYTGFAYMWRRRRYRGANIVGPGFLLWGLLLLGFPFLNVSPAVTTLGYLGSAVLSIMIAIGMIVEQEGVLSEQTYRVLFDWASDAIFLLDLKTLRIVDANWSAQRLTGRNHTELFGYDFLALCPDLRKEGTGVLDGRKIFAAMYRQAVDLSLLRSNGTRVLCESTANVAHCHKRPVLQISAREITDKRMMEQQLRQAEKLSALGRLIAGVAHELNNPLAVVIGYAQIMMNQKDMTDKARSALGAILHESERAGKIVGKLLRFTRSCEPHRVLTDMNQLVSTVLEAQKSEISAGEIELVARLSEHLPRTQADAGQVEQVLTHLITNAAQAMASHKGKRVLKVTTESDDLFIRIVVADTGPGIRKEILGKIFEPFFTTKPPGQGTGLGLSICCNIVEAHRGRMWVESEVGKGTKFFVELPIVSCTEEADLITTAAQELRPDSKASERRLLIVDDEPGILGVLTEVLTSQGYNVDTACNGADAMRQISDGRYDAIISDVRMPGMDGKQLYETLKKNNPQLANRVIFVTGDDVNTDTCAFLEMTGTRWLRKPFNISEIEEVVGNFLREEPGSAAASEGSP
jgi:PAS domain S-box-containing protein